MRTIWTFIDEAGGAATNVTSQNSVSRALAQIGWRGQDRIRFVRVADDSFGAGHRHFGG